MALRWKIPELQQNFVDPEGVRATMASQAASQSMQGYNPAGSAASANMQGYSQPEQNAPGYRGMAPGESPMTQNVLRLQQEIAELESQLQEVDAQIAAIDKDMGGLTPEEAQIAAKRASVGDMSAYDAMVSRRGNQFNTAKTAMDGINNKLYEAEKLTYGLDSKDDVDRAAARNQIEVALRQAEETAEKTGGKLPESYHRLKAKLEEADRRSEEVQNSREYANSFWSKAKANSLTDADIASAKEFVAKNPNNPEAEKIRDEVDKYEQKTNEAKAAAQREKNAAYQLYKDIKDLSKEQASAAYAGWTEKQKKAFKKYYKFDENNGTVTKK